MKLTRGMWMMTAALLLAACGGESGGAAAAGADSTAAAAVPAPAATADSAQAGGTSTPLPPEMANRPAAAPASAPSAADSAAAAREDVSPEWKQRQRSMASYEQCMEQASGAENPMRQRLEEACSRLPGAPK